MKINSSRLVRALDDPDVARWHANLAERSELTADIYTRRLDRLCDEFKTSPRALWGLDSKSAYNFLVDAVKHYRDKGLADSTIKGYLKPVISWLREKGIELTRPVNISGASQTPPLDAEKTPEPYKLASVWRFCILREVAAIALEAPKRHELMRLLVLLATRTSAGYSWRITRQKLVDSMAARWL